MYKSIIISIVLSIISLEFFAQSEGVVIDEIVAIVGSKPILKSDIENQKLQLQAQGYYPGNNIRCEILEELLFQKLLLNQAILDSVEVTEKEVSAELDRKMRFFVSQIGSEKRLEEYYKKSIPEIKEELRELLHDQMITQRMQSELTDEIKVTPSEVRKYFNSMPEDSLPLINSEMELNQIVRYPHVKNSEILAVKERLEKFRERLNNGESFTTLAALYSEDPGSTAKGGELGFVGRGDLVPEFAAVAFNLKGKEISRIVKTEFGYHIIQLIERKGELINVKHILLKPKVSPVELQKAYTFLDSLKNILEKDTLTFKQAAWKFSHDVDTRANAGLMINLQTGSSNFEINQIDPTIYHAVKDLKINEISAPFKAKDDNGKDVYKIVQLKSKSKPHKASIKEDYNLIQDMTLMNKQQDYIDDWIVEKQKETYIKVKDAYKDCDFQFGSW